LACLTNLVVAKQGLSENRQRLLAGHVDDSEGTGFTPGLHHGQEAMLMAQEGHDQLRCDEEDGHRVVVRLDGAGSLEPDGDLPRMASRREE
jgi:hypothetical protein